MIENLYNKTINWLLVKGVQSKLASPFIIVVSIFRFTFIITLILFIIFTLITD